MKHLVIHILSELKKHTLDYLLLITSGVFFLISLNIFRGEKSYEFMIILIFVSFYIIWGIYHHIGQNSLHLKNVLEYILIGFTVLYFLKIVFLP